MAFLGNLMGYYSPLLIGATPSVLTTANAVPTTGVTGNLTLVDGSHVTLNTGTAISGLARITVTTERTIGTASFYPSLLSTPINNNIVSKWPDDPPEEENLWTKDWD